MSYSYKKTTVKGVKYIPAVAAVAGVLVGIASQYGVPDQWLPVVYVLSVTGGVWVYDFAKHKLGVKLP